MMKMLMERLPFLSFFFGTFAFVFLSIMAGFGIGAWRRKTAGVLAGPVGSVVGAILGLLAFMLAFTFGIAASRFDARKKLLLDEVIAIETAFKRADLIVEPHRTECRDLLKKYVQARVSAAYSGQEAVPDAIARSEELQAELWRHAGSLALLASNPEMESLFIQSVNDLINIHTMRVTTSLQYRIPGGVWFVLFCLTFFAMVSVGYQFGVSGGNSFVAYFILAMAFSLIITIIADLDSPTRGKLKVNQRPMIELQTRLNAVPTTAGDRS